MRYLMTALGLLGMDLGIKEYIEKNKREDTDEKKGAFIIRKYHNKGAFLNLGQTRPGMVIWLSVLFTAGLTVCYAVTLGRAGKKQLKWGLTLLTAGAYSNTCDRVRKKYVVDYVSFCLPWKRLRGIVFNLGDFCIMAGSLICLAAEYGCGE